METPNFSVFTVEDISAGAHAHGFGRTAEGNPFMFRVRRRTLHIDVYRADCLADVPGDDDVIATARKGITEIDLTDERSIIAAVRDAVANTEPV